MSEPAEHRFRARIYRVGILRCVDLPEAVSLAFGDWDHAPVRVRVGRGEAHTRLVPRCDGGHRVFLDGRLRKAAGVDTDDEIELVVALDESVDREPFPDDLMATAESIDGGVDALLTLPPGLRGQILRFLAGARSEPTRRKRLTRCAELLAERIERQTDAED